MSNIPGKRGCLPNNSANIQPIDQISTALEYSEGHKITSGARYQRVITYLNFDRVKNICITLLTRGLHHLIFAYQHFVSSNLRHRHL
jgi:hypothetical protein